MQIEGGVDGQLGQQFKGVLLQENGDRQLKHIRKQGTLESTSRARLSAASAVTAMSLRETMYNDTSRKRVDT